MYLIFDYIIFKMLGRSFNNFKVSVSNTVAKMQPDINYEFDSYKPGDATGLPIAPRSAFRKRPVKLHYDPNEFH